MNEKILEALKASILKWEDNTKITHISEAKIWGDTCELCKAAGNNCSLCPVYEQTGESNCEETPWEATQEVVADVKSLSAPLSAFHRAAQKEVDFLKSLLPEDQS